MKLKKVGSLAVGVCLILTLLLTGVTPVGAVDDVEIQYTTDASGKKVITSISLPAFPETVPFGVINPDCFKKKTAEYQLLGCWYEMFEDPARDSEIDAQGRKFPWKLISFFREPCSEGKVYQYIYDFQCRDGVVLAENVQVTVGGRPVNSFHDILPHAEGRESIALSKLYNLSSMKEIHRLDLSIELPKVGEEIENESYLEMKLDNCRIEEWRWEETESPKMPQQIHTVMPDRLPVDTPTFGNFKENTYYWGKAIVRAEQGYIFAEDMKVTVNGAEVETYWGDPLIGGLYPKIGEFVLCFVYKTGDGILAATTTTTTTAQVTTTTAKATTTTTKATVITTMTNTTFDTTTQDDITQTTATIEAQPTEDVSGGKADGISGGVVALIATGAIVLIVGGFFVGYCVNKKQKKDAEKE